MKRIRTYSPMTLEAVRMLGGQVRQARLERRWTLQQLAERAGVTHVTMRKVEEGDPSVALGTAFEAAALVGVPLFAADAARRTLEAGRIEDRLTVLPKRARLPSEPDDDF
jgi:transcriptional regulator with XRE-family HTH domain